MSSLQSLQEQLDALQSKVRALESELEATKKLNGIPGPAGPRGASGDIVAAVRQATAASEQIVADAEARIRDANKLNVQQFTDRVDQLRADIKAEVDLATVKVLEAYGVVSDFDGKRIKA